MKEIERKFLVHEIPDLNNIQKKEFEQGYLSFVPEIRIRKEDNKYFKTTKSEGTLCRDEYNEEISKEQYFNFVKKLKSKLIKKTRYYIPLNTYIAELDIYKSVLEGLLMVEVEFASEYEAKNFNPPNWFGKEVTYDMDFKNKNLAKMLV